MTISDLMITGASGPWCGACVRTNRHMHDPTGTLGQFREEVHNLSLDESVCACNVNLGLASETSGLRKSVSKNRH
jgi:hypothetical protein